MLKVHLPEGSDLIIIMDCTYITVPKAHAYKSHEVCMHVEGITPHTKSTVNTHV